MVTMADARNWNAATLERVFQTVRARQQVLTSSGDDFVKAMPVDGWQGSAAENAMSAHQSLIAGLDHLAAGVSIVNKTIAQAADAIPAMQRAIADAEDLAAKYGYAIGDDGTVTDVLTHPGPHDPNPADRSRVRQEVIDAISQSLRTAENIDNDLATVLRRAATGGFGTGTETTVQGAEADALQESRGEILPAPPPHGTASENAAWWNSLSAAGQAILLHDHPDWLGNLDGLPGAVRSKANLARLPELRTQVQGQITQLQTEVDQLAAKLRSQPLDPVDTASYLADKADLSDAEAKLASLNTITSLMSKQPPRQLLTLDLTGKRAHAAVAVGNVDTAEHVAVFTPGFNSTVDGSLGNYDQNMSDLRAVSQQIATNQGDGGRVATVTWLGYDAPQTDEVGNVIDGNSVLSTHAATVGAAKLDGFLNGLGAAHDDAGQPLHLTALGHSYGSLTTGIALQSPTPVHDAVVFGSPWMDIIGTKQLQVPVGHVFAEWAQNDPVPELDIGDVFGVSPYKVPGIQLMPTDTSSAAGQQLQGSIGHSEYLNDHTTSQYNMATIVAGQSGLRAH